MRYSRNLSWSLIPGTDSSSLGGTDSSSIGVTGSGGGRVWTAGSTGSCGGVGASRGTLVSALFSVSLLPASWGCEEELSLGELVTSELSEDSLELLIGAISCSSVPPVSSLGAGASTGSGSSKGI